jgi:hypothetical protein
MQPEPARYRGDGGGRDGQTVSLTDMAQVIEDWEGGEWAGEDHRGNAGRVKGETTYVGSRGPRGKRTHGIFHPRLLKEQTCSAKGKEIISDHAPQEGWKLGLPLRKAGMM